jgi:hypothetical protein
VKNVTASLDDDTSMRRELTELGAGETEFQRLKREERAVRAQIPAGFGARHNVPPDRLSDRNRQPVPVTERRVTPPP